MIRTIVALTRAIDAQPRVALVDLPAANFCEGLNGREAAVFCQCQRHGLQCSGERADCVLLDGRDLGCGRGQREIWQ